MNPKSIALVFIFWLALAVTDFLITIYGVFFLGKPEGTYPIELLIRHYGLIGFVSSSIVYLIMAIYAYKKYPASVYLFVLLASLHFAGVLSWSNTLKFWNGPTYALLIPVPYIYFSLLMSIPSLITFHLGRISKA